MEGDEEYFDMIFKIIIIGDSGVGKTNILLQYIKGKFDHKSKATIGAELGIKSIKIKNNIVRVQLVDTAGQERFRSITKAYYRGAHGALVVYDITNRLTFDSIDKWINETKENANEKIVVSLIGNKNDLSHERQVSVVEGLEKAAEKNISFFETSALDKNNIDKTLTEIINNIYDVFKEDVDEEDLVEEEAVIESFNGKGIDFLNVSEKEKSCCDLL